MVGLYMRQSNPELNSALALPLFIAQHFPSIFSGVAFATLLIAAIGTASGLALGVSTTLKIDILDKALSETIKKQLWFFRGLTAMVVLSAFILLLGNLGSAIMDWSFLSMGLRGATIFFPLLFAVFLHNYNLRRFGTWAIIIAPACVIVTGLTHFEFLPPLYFGLITSLTLLCLNGVWRQ
jgi:SSS family solute:Na+ symporter